MLGAGSSKKIAWNPPSAGQPTKIVTLDIEPSHGTDVVWDLNVLPWPFEDSSFDEIHAYEVLEHLGQQGDAKSFFDHFYEAWRILRPGGHLIGSVPRWDSVWAWGDPSHRRIISEGSFAYLDLPNYSQVGKTAMTDFRSLWKGDLETIEMDKTADQLYFTLKAHKPRRN